MGVVSQLLNVINGGADGVAVGQLVAVEVVVLEERIQNIQLKLVLVFEKGRMAGVGVADGGNPRIQGVACDVTRDGFEAEDSVKAGLQREEIARAAESRVSCSWWGGGGVAMSSLLDRSSRSWR